MVYNFGKLVLEFYVGNCSGYFYCFVRFWYLFLCRGGFIFCVFGKSMVVILV